MLPWHFVFLQRIIIKEFHDIREKDGPEYERAQSGFLSPGLPQLIRGCSSVRRLTVYLGLITT